MTTSFFPNDASLAVYWQVAIRILRRSVIVFLPWTVHWPVCIRPLISVVSFQRSKPHDMNLVSALAGRKCGRAEVERKKKQKKRNEAKGAKKDRGC
mmetsp:Transcript_62708/g.86205  ORF Transcript_62708/g.86205 Transcript_62708/m.86205 type:complete len:96 (-) Transcript_62708:41-328(-)